MDATTDKLDFTMQVFDEYENRFSKKRLEHKKRKAWQEDDKAEIKETLKADLVLLALGFLHPVQEKLLNELGVNEMQSKDTVFIAGDATMGASLVVKAIASGRKAAEKIHSFLSIQKD